MRTVRVLLGPALGSAGALAAFLLLYLNPGWDPLLAAPRFHFWLVSATSLLAFGLATAVAWVGGRGRDGRILYLGAGLAGLAGFFALHGLATPGFLIQAGSVPGVSAQLAVLSLAAWMFVAAHPRPTEEAPVMLRRLAAWSVFLVGCIVVGLARPELARFVPVDENPLRWVATLVLLGLLGATGTRFLEAYRLSRSGLHLVMLHVVGWLAVTQVIMVVGDVFQLSWWLYHAVLLVAVAAMLVAMLRQMQAGRLGAGLRALLRDDPEARLDYGLRPEVRALVVATEAKDPYTAGHMQRVARNAVMLGRELGFGPEDLRSLAQAGTIHDVGKLDLPDAVLNKPGPLDEREFEQVKSHPVVGARIAEELGLHLRELEIVRHHHERWDGKGYPDGLAGEAIPRLARTLAVVDVYDAVTSERSYRRPMDREAALRVIRDGAGTAFDPRYARAWVEMEPSAGVASGASSRA